MKERNKMTSKSKENTNIVADKVADKCEGKAEYLKTYERWLASDIVSADTKEELKAIAGNDDEIKNRFEKMMSFGTSGLRGLMRAGLNGMNVYTVRLATQGMANLILGSDKSEGEGVVIAHDSRNNSELFAKETAKVLAGNGITVYFFDALRPTPELSYAIRELGTIAGVNITASHNPKEYNGYKAYWADGTQLSPAHADVVSAEFEKIDIFDDVKLVDFDEAVSEGLIKIIGEDLDEKYLEQVCKQSVGKEFIEKSADSCTIVYTPFHGAGYKLVPEVLRRNGFRNIVLVDEQMVIDGDFPTVASPNPENREGFALALEYARKNDAELVIGTDPDSDRCGSAVRISDNGDYMILSGNQMGCLMLDYLITVKKEQGSLAENAVAIKSIVTTTMANRICEANGVHMEEVLTGFKFIGEKITEYEKTGEYSFLFGFEESIGFLAGSYARDKDAVVSAMLMAELACYYKSKGMTVYEGLQALYKKYGFFRETVINTVFEGFSAQEQMAGVMTRLRADKPKKIGLDIIGVTDYLDDIPGFTKSNVLFYKLSDGCAVAIRPSGTEPKVKTYIFAQGSSDEEAKANLEIVRSAVGELLK